MERDLKESEAIRVREFEEYKKLTQSEMIKLENQLKDYNFFMSEREKMEKEKLFIVVYYLHTKNQIVKGIPCTVNCFKEK